MEKFTRFVIDFDTEDGEIVIPEMIIMQEATAQEAVNTLRKCYGNGIKIDGVYKEVRNYK